MNQKEIGEYNLQKTKHRLETNYKLLPLIFSSIRDLKKERNEILDQIKSDKNYIELIKKCREDKE